METDSTTTQDGGDTSATDDATDTASVQTQDTNGSETDKNSGEAMVPSHRVREATEARRAAEAERDQLRQELEASRQQTTASSNDEDIDPEVQTLVTKILEKGGYVKKGDVDAAVKASDLQRQYNEDVATLTSKYGKTGVPFKSADVRTYANDNGINITSKASMEAAYRQMNYEKILDAERNAAIAAYKEGGKTSAEKPGSEGAKKPEEQEVRGLKNRIALARSKLK